MIYEARPNVTAEAAALCLKAGNGVILRGGSEAIHSNTAIAQALAGALQANGVPPAAVTVLTDLRREAMLELLQLHELIDLAIPRGGEGLIRFVAEHARVPVIKHYKGVCHLFVDASADLGKALDLLVDGKCSRPAACNSLETLLVHREVAETFLPRVAQVLGERGVQLRADAQAQPLLPGSTAATEEDYAAEFLDLVLAVRVVDDLEAAIAHIRAYTSDHTEVIATEDAGHAERFVAALGGSDGQCLVALLRRWPAGPGQRDRHFHHAPACVRPNGPGSTHRRTICRARRRADAQVDPRDARMHFAVDPVPTKVGAHQAKRRPGSAATSSADPGRRLPGRHTTSRRIPIGRA